MNATRSKNEGFMLRFPEGMRERLRAAAEANERSMNTEIVDRLEASLGPANPQMLENLARERVRRAAKEMREALAELDLAEMLS